jgi:hypothetical protein
MQMALVIGMVACKTGPDTGVDARADAGADVAAQVSRVETSLDAVHQTLLTVSWEQGAEAVAWVEYRVDEGEWRVSPARDVAPGSVAQLLLGIPYEHTVTFRVANDLGAGPVYSEEHRSSTPPPPDDLPEPQQVLGDSSQWDSGMDYVLLSMSDSTGRGAFAFIIDRAGRTVWARRSPDQATSLHPRVSQDGTQLLIDDNSFWAVFDGGDTSRVQRMHIDGTIVETIETPGLHHPFTDLPDGSLAWPANEGFDERIMVRAPDGQTRTVFQCWQFLQSRGFSGHCGANTLWYNAETDSFLYSLYSAETVLEVDHATGEVRRWFGQLSGSWDFSPSTSAFWWQHGAHITAEGTLLVSSKDIDKGTETVVREYAFSEADETLEEVWRFGIGEGVYGSVMGEAHRLASGNTLHNYGSATRLREVTPGGDVVWDVDWATETLGRSTPIADLYTLMPPSEAR